MGRKAPQVSDTTRTPDTQAPVQALTHHFTAVLQMSAR